MMSQACLFLQGTQAERCGHKLRSITEQAADYKTLLTQYVFQFEYTTGIYFSRLHQGLQSQDQQHE
jgi:hypothetical protein